MNLLREDFRSDDETVRPLTPSQIVEDQLVALATNAVAMTQILETAKTLIGANLDKASYPDEEDWIETMASLTGLVDSLRGIAPILNNLNKIGKIEKETK